jgi:hypothetical protein
MSYFFCFCVVVSVYLSVTLCTCEFLVFDHLLYVVYYAFVVRKNQQKNIFRLNRFKECAIQVLNLKVELLFINTLYS